MMCLRTSRLKIGRPADAGRLGCPIAEWGRIQMRIPGLKAREVTARGEAQRSPGERPSIYARPVRPEHRCIECAGLSGLGISALRDPALQAGLSHRRPSALMPVPVIGVARIRCRAGSSRAVSSLRFATAVHAVIPQKESNQVQANDFHRREAETRRDCGVGEKATERDFISRSGPNAEAAGEYVGASLPSRCGSQSRISGHRRRPRRVQPGPSKNFFGGSRERGPNHRRSRGAFEIGRVVG
jgi:hypothetical protein